MPSLISFIIPAHNEAFEISRTLHSVFHAARAVGQPFEVIVTNDASTDATATLAREVGAKILDVQLRQISAVRNAGARAAQGDLFVFIDADTQISAETLRATLSAIENGAVGGGATVEFAESFNGFISTVMTVFNFFYMRVLGWAAGCFLFAERKAFESAGGFDETLYAGEEIVLSRALKRQGKFVVLRESVKTSGRKIRMYPLSDILPFLFRFMWKGPAILRQRQGLEWWYEGKREK